MSRRSFYAFVVCLCATDAVIAFGCSDFSASDGAAPGVDGATDVDGGGPVPEAGAADGADSAPASTFCTYVDAAFCADFETPPVSRGWAAVVESNGSVKIGPPGAPASPLGALVIATTPLEAGPDGGPVEAAYVYQTITRPGAARVSFAADVQVVRAPSGETLASVITIAFGDAKTDRVTLAFFPGQGAAVVEDGGPDASGRETFTFVTPPLGSWFHANVDLDAEHGTMTVSIDGATVQDRVPIFATGSELVYFAVGAVALPGPTGNKLLVDNVVVTTH